MELAEQSFPSLPSLSDWLADCAKFPGLSYSHIISPCSRQAGLVRL